MKVKYTFCRGCVAIVGVLVHCIVPMHDAEARAKRSAADDWTNYGGDHEETHYSSLDAINSRNISRLSLAWWFDIDGVVLTQSVPLQVQGALYFVTGYSVVRAVDAATGRLLWTFDPEVFKHAGREFRVLWGVRGIAYSNNMVYVGTHDGRLIAINAKTGKAVWSVKTNDAGDARIITGPPRVFDDKVIIGHAAGEWGQFGRFAAVRGYVTAYDAEDGRRIWRFFTVPGDPKKGFENKAMELAAGTWTGNAWHQGGGGTVWNGITYDPAMSRVYIGTSNGFPVDASVRSPGGGDNLFLNSIVALDANSGAYIWHYQLNPAETWDYDATEDIVLATLKVAGKARHVLMQASKNGFFYVIDRKTGKLISAKKFAKVTWAERVDLDTGRPIETEFARDPSAAMRIWPSGAGAHSWTPMAFNPITQLMYVPVLDTSCPNVQAPVDRTECPDTAWLLAWDPTSQSKVWRIPLPGSQTGGVLTTAGNLVFQGDSEGRFSAYEANNGTKLWTFDAQVGIAGAPITYRVGRRQYVSVLAGYNGGGAVVDPRWDARTQRRRLLTFAIDGGKKLPAALPRTGICPLVDAGFRPDLTVEQYGAKLFSEHCAMCHGHGVKAGGQAPELRASGIVLSQEAFDVVVRRGLLQMNGMPRFEELKDDELESIRQYIRSRAAEWAQSGAAENGFCTR